MHCTTYALHSSKQTRHVNDDRLVAQLGMYCNMHTDAVGAVHADDAIIEGTQRDVTAVGEVTLKCVFDPLIRTSGFGLNT